MSFNPPQDSRWAEGQTNENNERTDDLDGAAEGENDGTNVSGVVNTTAPVSRPISRGSFYGRERDRDVGGADYSHPHGSSGRSRHRNSQAAGGEALAHNVSSSGGRSRNDSYRDPGFRNMNGAYGFGGADPYFQHQQRYPPFRGYPDPYYMGGSGYGAGAAVGGYGAQPPQRMTKKHQGMKEILERFRVEDPVGYRHWYEQYQAHRHNPTRVPEPSLPYPYGGGPPSMGAGPYPGMYGPSSSNRSMYNEPVGERGTHSGRSSVTEELSRYYQQGMPAYNNGPSTAQTPSINQDPEYTFKSIPHDSHYRESPEPEPQRTTPLKFNSAHNLGLLTPLGRLIRIKQGTTIEIVSIKSLVSHLPEYKEVEIFPGPLVKGTTHKNKVISFCQKKVKEAQSNADLEDKDNFLLLWELLILLLRQNGNVVGSDIAELLVGNKGGSGGRSVEDIIGSPDDQDEVADDEEEEDTNPTKQVPDAKATEKFCELLLYGHKKDALKYAMDCGLWGHALFLATKMDERTYGNVLARFANCIAFNHPLQTFYQLLSGKQPASANSCCEDSFGDWKPHLAMILSNAGVRPDVEVKSLTRMGDTLAHKGLVYAAQFCYLMGKQEFSPSSKLGILLGYCESRKNIIEATQMTEIYEFALSLSEANFTLGLHFIQSKFEYAKTLLSLGFAEEAFSYCEEIANKFQYTSQRSAEIDVSVLKSSVLEISERLVNVDQSNNGVEPKWIQDLRSELSNPSMRRLESISASDSASERRFSNAESAGASAITEEYRPVLEPVSNQVQSYDQPATTLSEYNSFNPTVLTPGEGPSAFAPPATVGQQQQQAPPMVPMYNPQGDIGGQPDDRSAPSGPSQFTPISSEASMPYQHQQSEPQPQQQGFHQNQFVPPSNPGMYSNDNNNYIPSRPDNVNYNYGQSHQGSENQPPASFGGVNMGNKENIYNQPPPVNSWGQSQNHPAPNSVPDDKQSEGATKKEKKSSKENESKEQKKGWWPFKWGAKGPNQMILPDDTDKTIVYDPNLKRWVNTQEDGDDSSGPKGPPPTDFDLSKGAMMNGQPGMAPPPMMLQTPQFQQSGPPSMLPSQMGNQSMGPPNPNSLPNVPMNLPGMNPNSMQQQQQQQQPMSMGPGMGPAGTPNVGFGTAPLMPNGSAGNKYKLSKSRGRYVDVLNPNATAKPGGMGNGNAPPMGGPPLSTPGAAAPPMVPNLFIPSPSSGPSEDSGPLSFLTPAPAGGPIPVLAQAQSETN